MLRCDLLAHALAHHAPAPSGSNHHEYRPAAFPSMNQSNAMRQKVQLHHDRYQ
ncbi:Uncharacterised protein [Vibrio cholerae]|nr:Uncharacterised protein [Vibrio cholerae]